MIPTLNKSHSSLYNGFSSEYTKISGATNPGVPTYFTIYLLYQMR